MATQFTSHIPTMETDSNDMENMFTSHAKAGILELKIEGDRKSPGDVSDFHTFFKCYAFFQTIHWTISLVV